MAVLVAAGGVFATASHWPDLAVAAIIAALCLHSSVDVLRRARAELGEAAQENDVARDTVAGYGD